MRMSVFQMVIVINKTISKNDKPQILKQIEDFRKNPETRKLLNEWVIDEANSIKQEEESLNKILRQCVESELQYVKRLYGKDYENAYASACSVIKQLSNSKEGAPYKHFGIIWQVVLHI